MNWSSERHLGSRSLPLTSVLPSNEPSDRSPASSGHSKTWQRCISLPQNANTILGTLLTAQHPAGISHIPQARECQWMLHPKLCRFLLPGQGQTLQTSQQCTSGAAAADSRANKEFFSLKHLTALHLGRFSLCNKEI